MDQKDNAGKVRMSLIVPGWLWETAAILTHGATKYAPNGWQRQQREEYVDALGRHYAQILEGQALDPETGLSQHSHVACNAMFLWWFDNGQQVTIPRRSCQCMHCRRPGSMTETRHISSPNLTPGGCVPPSEVRSILAPQFSPDRRLF